MMGSIDVGTMENSQYALALAAMNTRSQRRNRLLARSTYTGLLCAFGVLVVWWRCAGSRSNLTSDRRRIATAQQEIMIVWSDFQDTPVARRQQSDLLTTMPSDAVQLIPMVMDESQQRDFLRVTCGIEGSSRWEELTSSGNTHLATELWKYCALRSQKKATAYVDLSSPFVIRLQDPLGRLTKSIAVLGESYLPGTIHGSILVLQESQLHVADKMYHLLLETPMDVMVRNPLLIPRALYALIANSEGIQNLTGGTNNAWYLLEAECVMSAHASEKFHWMEANSRRLLHHCPDDTAYCCSIYDPTLHRVVQQTKHPIHPLPKQPTHMQLPLHAQQGGYRVEDLPFISTLQEQSLRYPSHAGRSVISGLFDILLRNDCLPTDRCNDCLRNTMDGCNGCIQECSCYCRTLCRHRREPNLVTQRIVVTPPIHSLDPDRLIPPIIHQLTPDNLGKSAYWFPDTSRTVRSLQMSGWRHRSYLLDDAEKFIATHFPAEVKEAFNDLTSDSLKQDLFRYCVLLIHGGVYANVDTLLESSLESVIDPDIGFIASTDSRTEGCLWQGFLASTPGHPFLAKAIENIVNQVRNRYQLVDLDASSCPVPQLKSTRIDKSVAATGSCLLSKSTNWVLSRPLNRPFTHGEVVVRHAVTRRHIPGRVVILRGDRNDMGSHRLTFQEKNCVVAEVNVPVEQPEQTPYATVPSSNDKHGRYDYMTLYRSTNRANQDIQIEVAVPL